MVNKRATPASERQPKAPAQDAGTKLLTALACPGCGVKGHVRATRLRLGPVIRCDFCGFFRKDTQ